MANLTWRFPPKPGGIDFVIDPSSAHFSDVSIPKPESQLIQNSLDAKQSGLVRPVLFRFSETLVGRRITGTSALVEHFQSCLDRERAVHRPAAAKVFSEVFTVIKEPSFTYPEVQDTGTTGLNVQRWKALVLRVGTVKRGSEPGGSCGISKNATLNLSHLQTVFYSTRPEEGCKGRVEKMQRKATFTGHPDPSGFSEDLRQPPSYGLIR